MIDYFQSLRSAFYDELTEINNGTLIKRHDNGAKYFDREYADGQRNGQFQSWFDNGNWQCQGKYVDGEKDGIWYAWYDALTNNLEYEIAYDHGKKNGDTKYYDNKGNMVHHHVF